MTPTDWMGAVLAAAAVAAFAVVLWLFGPRRMTRSVAGFAAWMTFAVLATLALTRFIAPDAPLHLVVGGAIVIGLLGYAVNYQIDDRRASGT